MDPDRWRQIERILDEALAVEPAQWSEVLDARCGNDSGLRQEVEALLGRTERARDFLETPPAAVAAALIDESQPAEGHNIQGRRIGAFRIICEIGRGGMSRVFLAERADGQYEQQVALKLLRPGFDSDVDIVRFRAERQILASLNHPNIARLLDGGLTDDGLPYLVLERVEGAPIDQYCKDSGLSTRRRLELFLGVVAAVQYAHNKSVVHRDLKPSNILVTGDGTVKLLDFGLAKMLEENVTQAPATTRLRWMTPEYAAPEQVRGAPATARTDVYQLGAVLYELLVGKTPFGERARTLHELETAALEYEPEPLRGALRGDLNAIVLKALRKAPEHRYGSAQELADDIRRYMDGHPVRARRPTLWYRTSRLAARRRFRFAALAVIAPVLASAFWMAAAGDGDPEPSVVVLPFVNLSGDAANDHFGDGLTEEIITRLSAIHQLKVISRTSAMHYRGTSKSLRQIADELKVAHVVEGSVRQSDGRLRITAQLIDAATDKPLWTDSYDYERMDVFRVQEEIAQEIVQGLELELGEQERVLLARHGTRDPEAYELYRQGRFFWNMRTTAAHEQALAYYQRAIERDSSYADPYAGIADAYLTAYQHSLANIPEAEIYSRQKWAAERALALDDQSAAAHTSVAVALWWQRNWPGAGRELRRAIELNPGHAPAHGWYALLLSGLGRPEEALREVRRASELDPFVAATQTNYGQHCYFVRDYDCAIEQFHRAIEIDSAWTLAHAALGLAYAHKRMYADAIRTASKAVELRPQRSPLLADLAYVLVLAGRKEEAMMFLQRAKVDVWEGFNIARVYVALGQRDSAFVWLDRSSWHWPHRALRSDPALDPVRSDPRFAQLSARIEREMGIR